MASANFARVSSVIPSNELPNQAKLYLITWPDAQAVQRFLLLSFVSRRHAQFQFFDFGSNFACFAHTHTKVAEAKQNKKDNFKLVFEIFLMSTKTRKFLVICDFLFNPKKVEKGKGGEVWGVGVWGRWVDLN